MLYSKHLTLAKGGTEATSTTHNFIANKGVINTIWINFPPGCAGLVKVRVLLNGHTFVPSNADEYINADGYVYKFEPFVEILEEPEQVTIQAWNEDDTYAHVIDVQISIIDRSWIQPIGAYEGIVAALKSLFVRS